MLVNSWLDKVLKVSDNNGVLSEYTYFNSGQLANATHNPVAGDNNAMTTETFVWDGLALIDRNGTSYINEPHAGGGNPVLAISGGNGTQAIFNDMLGTSVGTVSGGGYSSIEKTTFGYNETIDNTDTNFYTGKPNVRNLGYVFLMRNYRSDLGKWQTEDPIGYPDGWNNFAYCNNRSTSGVDLYGLLNSFDYVLLSYYWIGLGQEITLTELDPSLETAIFNEINNNVISKIQNEIDNIIINAVKSNSAAEGSDSIIGKTISIGHYFGDIAFSLGGGTVTATIDLQFEWVEYTEGDFIYRDYFWIAFNTEIKYSDEFKEPFDIDNSNSDKWDDWEVGFQYKYWQKWDTFSIPSKGGRIKMSEE